MKNAIANTFTVFISSILFLLLLEVGGRLYDFEIDLFYFENLVSRKIDLFESVYPAAYHPNLGYIPKPGTTGADNYWGKTITILKHGVRSNGDNGKAHDARGASSIASTKSQVIDSSAF